MERREFMRACAATACAAAVPAIASDKVEPRLYGRARLVDAGGKPIGRLLASQIGSGPDANAYAMAEGGDVVYRLRGYLYAHLDKKKEDFVEAPAPTAK